MSESTDSIYRVVRFPQTLLTAMRAARDAAESTNARYIANVVDDRLPELLDDLKRIGFGAFAGKSQTARLPFSDESATLGQLKEAAETVGLPMTKLLELCMVAAVRARQNPKRQRQTKRKSDKSAETASGQRRHRKGRRVGG